MGINLCGGKTGMSQHSLNGTKIRSMLKKMRCEGVPQRMRRHRRSEARLTAPASKQFPKSLAGQCPAASGHKHIGRRGCFDKPIAPRRKILLKFFSCHIPKRNHPLFGTLADGHQIPGDQIELADLQADQFRHAKRLRKSGRKRSSKFCKYLPNAK